MAIKNNSQPSPELKGKTIFIGAAGPLSGPASVLGREMSQAIQFAVDECNEKGGIFGVLVELDIADDTGKVEEGDQSRPNEQILHIIG